MMRVLSQIVGCLRRRALLSFYVRMMLSSRQILAQVLKLAPIMLRMNSEQLRLLTFSQLTQWLKTLIASAFHLLGVISLGLILLGLSGVTSTHVAMAPVRNSILMGLSGVTSTHVAMAPVRIKGTSSQFGILSSVPGMEPTHHRI